MAATFNEDLINFLLIKSHYLYRLENGTFQDMIVPYRRAKRDILKEIAKLEDTGTGYFLPQRIDRLNKVIAEINEVLRLAALESAGKLDTVRQQLAELEASDITNRLNKYYGKIGISMDEISYNQIDFILNNPMLGESVGDKMLWANQDALRRMRQELYQSIIQGEDMRSATNRLLGSGIRLGGDTGALLINRARMIARTEIMHVSNQINMEIFRNNQDVLKGVIYTATLDNRTCQICAALDAKIYLFDSDETPPINPRHPQCRCTYAPLTYSWAELQQRMGVPVTKQSNKDYFSGRTDGIIKTYSQWFDEQEPDTQRQILGKKRFDQYIKGEYKIGQEMAVSAEAYTVGDYAKVCSTI